MSVFVFHEVYIHILACNPIIVYSVEIVFKNLCSKLFRNITPTTMLTHMVPHRQTISARILMPIYLYILQLPDQSVLSFGLQNMKSGTTTKNFLYICC